MGHPEENPAAQPWASPQPETTRAGPKRRSIWRSLWLGQEKRRRWLGMLLGGILAAFLADLLWDVALELARWEPPLKTFGLVLAFLTAALVLLSLWWMVRVFWLLGVRRVLVVLAIALVLWLSARVLVSPHVRPLGEEVLLQVRTAPLDAWDTLTSWGRALLGAPAAFRFAYTGTGPLIDLPGIEEEPTPIRGRIVEPLIHTTPPPAAP